MEHNPSASLPKIAASVIHDLRVYLEVIEPVTYQARLDLLSDSTIGQHTRHIIEFFNCLIDQADKGPHPVISYALRQRDYRIESDPGYALQLVQQICEQLEYLEPNKGCLLDCAEHGQADLLVPSTIGRELIYTIEHTIHHLAIVKIALRATLPSLPLPEHFGVAPSTIRYRQESCAQ